MAADNRVSQIQGVTIFFLTLAWISICARCYVKTFLTGLFGVEDWLAVLSLALFTVYSVSLLLGAAKGIGHHISDISPTDLSLAGKWWYCCEITYVLSATAVKFCIAMLLLRFCSKRIQFIVIWTVMAVVAVFSLFYLFLIVFQCHPISYLWLQYFGGTGSCLPTSVTTDSTYAHAAISATADWTLCLLPISVVWNLQMNPRTKISVAVILGLGALASTATIVRIPYIYHVTLNTDFLYNITDIAIWSVVEVGIAITASSMACLRPLFRVFLSRSKLIGSKTIHPHVGPWNASRVGYTRSHKTHSVEELRLHQQDAGKSIHVTTVVQTQSNHDTGDLESGIELGQQRNISGGALTGKNGWHHPNKLDNDSSEDGQQ